MNMMRSIIGLLASLTLLSACQPPPYGHELELSYAGKQRAVWAVAPALNLSGQTQVDPLLQADILYQQLQAVGNVTVIPVDRVIEVYSALHIEKVQSPQQAAVVCEQLGCDALVVPTITTYDPYDPPKMAAALQLLGRGGRIHQNNVDARELARRATPGVTQALPVRGDFLQAVGMFDAANGTVHDAVLTYAKGRSDPGGPLGAREYFVNMDRYCGFVYHALITDLVHQAELNDRSQ